LLALGVGPAAAHVPPGQGPHVRIASLIAETDHPAPGSEVTLAFASTPEPGWHGYWENPGDAGLPAKRRMDAADGRDRLAAALPVPQRLLDRAA
jgi:DsbC/DsbD-like thiol-disulfide interchange protein